MSRLTFFLSAILASMAMAPIPVRAQDSDVAGTLYSQGVEAFFAGRGAEADSCFSRAIAFNPNDPRVYYFRSLSRLRQGRQAEASADMQTGADLEAQRPNRYAIGKALERVQGPTRLLLEKYRAGARLKSAIAKPSFPAGVESDTAVLREQRFVPLEQFLQPGVPRSVAVPNAASASTSTSPPAAPAAKSPANQKSAPVAEANPFGDDAAAKTPPKESAPAPAPAPAAAPKTPPPAEKPASKDEDPFS